MVPYAWFPGDEWNIQKRTLLVPKWCLMVHIKMCEVMFVSNEILEFFLREQVVFDII